MPVAPDDRPGATRKNAMPVPRLERPPGRRREGPAGVIEFVLELALAGDAADRRVAGVALDRFGRDRPATIELACRRTRCARQRVEAGADDQLRPWAGAVALAA